MIQVSEKRQRQLTYIGITESDLELLKAHEPVFSQIVDQVVDELYEWIMQQPELKAIVESASTLERLKETQRWYFMSLAGGIVDEEYIANRPRFILVPPGQRSVEARKQVAATTPNSTRDVNAFAGSFEVIEEPRLFVAGGPQPWYMAADPNLVDTIEYAHLEGQMEPFLDQRAGFEVDGVEFKVRHDFAAKALDYRGLYKNAGANPA